MRGAVKRIDRRRFLGLVAVAGAGGVMVAASSKASAFGFDSGRETMLPPGVVWRLDPAKSDEFNGGFPDTAKWAGARQVEFADESVRVSDGLLRIRLSSDPPRQEDPSRAVRSRFVTGGDSYIEVRARVIGSGANAVIHHSDAGAQHIGRAGGPLDEGFHLYGLERRGGRVVFYIDGKPYRSYGKHSVAAMEPQRLVMHVRGIGEWEPINAEALPTTMLVDHVRVYGTT